MADIVLNGNTSGAITIAAPAVAGTNTLTLPASTSTIATTADVNALTTGKILQVVTATDSTERTTTSTSFVTASNTLSVNITPSATTSKIFVTASLSYGSPSGTHSLFLTLYRDSTNLASSYFGNLFDGSSYMYSHATPQILDSPSTTSAITYQVYFKVGANTGRINNSGGLSTITAIEVGV